jgi:hypothetical protein
VADYSVAINSAPTWWDRGIFAQSAAWWGEIVQAVVQEVPPELAYCEFDCRNPACNEACSRKGV